MIVKIDNRETSRICEAARYYMPKYKVIIEQLEIGDFIFAEGNDSVVFEYKAMPDLMWSINEGRLFDQAIKQANNFKNHNVIVEWSEKQKNHTNKQLKKIKSSLTTSEIHESLARLSTITNVIISPSKELSFPLMEKYAQISLEKSPFEKTVMEKTDNIAYNYLMLIEGVNTIKTHTICKHLKYLASKQLIITLIVSGGLASVLCHFFGNNGQLVNLVVEPVTGMALNFPKVNIFNPTHQFPDGLDDFKILDWLSVAFSPAPFLPSVSPALEDVDAISRIGTNHQ